MLLRDLFIALACLNSGVGYFKWADIFVVLYAMFIVDFAINFLLFLKYTVLGCLTIFPKYRGLARSYMQAADIFLFLVSINSPLLFLACERLARSIENHRERSALGLDITIVGIDSIQANLQKIADLFLLQIVIVGIITVHLSQTYRVTFSSSHHRKTPTMHRDHRISLLESCGLIRVDKAPFIFVLVDPLYPD